MSKLSGIFDQFHNLLNIPPEDINQWLKKRIDPLYLENYLANRITYPQTIPTSREEMGIDLAILKEVVKRHSERFLKKEDSMVIPADILNRFQPEYLVVAAFIDGLNLDHTTKIFIDSGKLLKLAGSIVYPIVAPEQDPVLVSVNNTAFSLKPNTLTLIPIMDSKVKVSINEGPQTLASGGELGLFLDLRKKRST